MSDEFVDNYEVIYFVNDYTQREKRSILRPDCRRVGLNEGLTLSIR